MVSAPLHVVTGAFGYSGKYIAKLLLDAGVQVRTLTNSPDRPNPFGSRVEARPFDFDKPNQLTESLKGAEVLYNTYWVRFNHKTFKHSEAVDNTLRLFDAAKKADVKRTVHVSITNPSLDSPLEYFSGKAFLEQALQESEISHAILRPTVLYGEEDILINNIAWVLRRMPFFGVFGKGEYRMQPIYVDDLAALAVEQGRATENRIINAIGPETFTYRGLVEEIGRIIDKPRRVVSVPPGLGYVGALLMGKLVGDVIITREEIEGLMAGLLCVDDVPAGPTKLTEWAKAHAATLGTTYASELGRRRDRLVAYSG